MKKLIYLSYLPLTETLEKFYFMDHAFASGMDIEYWDMSAVYPKNSSALLSVDRPYVRKILSFKEVSLRIEKEVRNNAIFISTMAVDFTFLGLFRTLTKHNATLFAIAIGRMPMPIGSFFKKVFNNLDYLIDFRKLSNFLGNRVVSTAKRLGLIKDYDVVFAAGGMAANLFNGSKIININNCYYDDFLMNRDSKTPLVKNRHCVFLDDNLAYHADINLLNVTPIDPILYYNTLNSFFTKIEEKYKLEVVIAAHPKSNYQSNPFQDRKIFKGATHLLAATSELAITTISTSAGLAVLNNKPVIFIYTDDIIRKYDAIKLGVLQKLSAESLGSPRVNIDDVKTLDDFHVDEIDPTKYASYKYNYIVSPESEKKLSKDIFLDFIKRCYADK